MAHARRDQSSSRQILLDEYLEHLQHGYQPRTLTSNNQERIRYLPVFPTEADIKQDDLLLSSVLVYLLSSKQNLRRRDGRETTDAMELMSQYDHQRPFSISFEECQSLADRLRVDMPIITFNADRLRRICYYFLDLHEQYRKNASFPAKISAEESSLSSSLMSIALEFFLQIDVDEFFMKTCSYRGATPRSVYEGLFCCEQAENERYVMGPCGLEACLCCHPLNIDQRPYEWPVVDFQNSAKHRFCKEYTSYLNCPATCSTKNIIYVMTCPCEEYDYTRGDTRWKRIAQVDSIFTNFRAVVWKILAKYSLAAHHPPIIRSSQRGLESVQR